MPDGPLDTDAAPEIERALREFYPQWNGAVDSLADSLTEALERGDIDLQNTRSIEAAIDLRQGEFTNDLELTFKQHTETAAKAGRAVAGRRHALDIAFDIVPRRTLKQLDDWSVTASEHISDTLAGDVRAYLRGAHEGGASVDAVAADLQDEFFDGRVKDWKAEQVARDVTVTPSNAGKHTAYSDAGSVVATEWLDSGDNRVRSSHMAADGQVVAVDQPFSVGGYRALHPGAPSLPVKEATQCRCVEVPRFPDSFSESELATLAAGGTVWQ